MKRILAPTDLTCEGRNSVDYAAALASRFGGELILLHVYEAKGSPDYSADVLDDTIVDDNQQRVEDKMKEWCAEIRPKQHHPKPLKMFGLLDIGASDFGWGGSSSGQIVQQPTGANFRIPGTSFECGVHPGDGKSLSLSMVVAVRTRYQNC